jgi:hypothetical protein
MLTVCFELTSPFIMRAISRATRTVHANIKKSFPDLLHAQLLSVSVLVEDCDGVRELGPKRSKTQIHCVFEQVTFMLVQGHPGGLLSVVNGEVSCGDELTSEVTTA